MSKGPPPPTDLQAALGRVPGGLFVLAVRDNDGLPGGMLASWVQQAGLDPPMITLTLPRERMVEELVRRSGRFVLNQIAEGDKTLLRRFARGSVPDVGGFDGLALHFDDPAGPILADALSFMILEPAGLLAAGDHVVFLARVVHGGLIQPDKKPRIHVRRDGSHY